MLLYIKVFAICLKNKSFRRNDFYDVLEAEKRIQQQKNKIKRNDL